MGAVLLASLGGSEGFSLDPVLLVRLHKVALPWDTIPVSANLVLCKCLSLCCPESFVEMY